MLNWLSELWCRSMHSGAMWPMHGKYVCPKCWREYPIYWGNAAEERLQAAEIQPGRAV
jgi:hypothetical protein